MLASGLKRSSVNARLLLQIAVERGLTPSQALRGTGLTEAALSAPANEIMASQEQRLMENMIDRIGDDPALALEAGRRSSLDQFGMLGFALMSSPTLREPVELSFRYQDLAFSLARCSLSRGLRVTYVSLDVRALPVKLHRFVLFRSIASIWTTMDALAEYTPSGTIEFVGPRPADTEPFVELFGSMPRFGATISRIGFDDAYLDRPRIAANPEALELCEQQCRTLLARRHAQVGSAGLVGERLARASGAVPSMATIASDLNVSVRTLRRSLHAEGTSFRALDEAARRERAEYLLEHTECSLDDIATKLGYATNSAFVRAFRRWHGCPPGAWRRRVIQQDRN